MTAKRNTVKIQKIDAGHYYVPALHAEIEYLLHGNEWVLSFLRPDGTDVSQGAKEAFDTLRDAKAFAAEIVQQRAALTDEERARLVADHSV